MEPDRIDVSRVGAEAIDSLLAIDDASFLRPWTRAMYESAFASAVTRVHMLAVGGLPVAYCSASIVAGEVHISNVAVLPAYRGRRLASHLLTVVLTEAESEGAPNATLEVRRSNRAALALYERLGFRTTAVRADYYAEPVEDALILWRTAGPAGAR
jgi:ribosomal-protein-alanine N-acetyltransferase